MPNQVEIDFSANTEQAAAQIRKLNGAMDDMQGAGKRARLSLADMKAGLDLAKQAFDAMQRVIGATVGKTVEYAEQVRDLARAMGANASEASKLIQAGDDLGIGYETLVQAAKKLNDEGISPNIANLGKLADEYSAMRDPVQRAQFAMDKFGLRAGPEMQKLLEKGSKGLEEMAQAAEDAGLVMSTKTARQARDLEIALDDLSDIGQGLALTIGTELLPVAQDFVEIGADAAPVVRELAQGFVEAWEAGEKLWKIQKLLMLELAALVAGSSAEEKALAGQIILNDGLTNAQLREVAATESQRKHWEAMATYFRNQATPATGEAIEAIDTLQRAINDLSLAIDGPMKRAQDEYYARQKEAGAAIVETQDRIKELTALPQLTDEQRAELAGLQTLLAEQKQAYEDNATAHEESTARILYGFLQQRLAADGWQKGELAFLAEVGKAWGIYDTQTANALDALDRNIEEHGLNAQAFLHGIGSAINSLPDYKLITIETLHKDTYQQAAAAEPGPPAAVYVPPDALEPGGPDSYSEPDPPSVPGHGNTPARATGGPVLAGMPYWVGEHGPEKFVPSVDGQIVPTDQAGPAAAVYIGTLNIGARVDKSEMVREISSALAAQLRGHMHTGASNAGRIR